MRTILFVLRRMVLGCGIFIAVTAMCFILYNLRGPAIVATDLLGPHPTPAQVASKIHALGMDRSIVVQYLSWLSGFIRGDLGPSLQTNLPISTTLANAIPITLSIFVSTFVLTVIFGVLLGVWAATRAGVIDRVLQLVAVMLQMVPGFYLALVIVIVFAIKLSLFPATGFIPIQTSFVGWLSTVTLPTVSISIGSIVGIAIWVRSNIIDLLRLDFVRTLRARGISERSILFKHVLRNAAAPTLTMLSFVVIGLLSGVIIIEQIYALHGLGSVALASGTAGDIPVVVDVTALMVGVIVVVNIIVDILNGILNPKARLA